MKIKELLSYSLSYLVIAWLFIVALILSVSSADQCGDLFIECVELNQIFQRFSYGYFASALFVLFALNRAATNKSNLLRALSKKWFYIDLAIKATAFPLAFWGLEVVPPWLA